MVAQDRIGFCGWLICHGPNDQKVRRLAMRFSAPPAVRAIAPIGLKRAQNTAPAFLERARLAAALGRGGQLQHRWTGAKAAASSAHARTLTRSGQTPVQKEATSPKNDPEITFENRYMRRR